MSSKRSRSKSRTPSRERKRQRDTRLPQDVDEITEDDYFLKMKEFQSWLKDDKDHYFDQLSSEKARHYFRKFVKKWNRGELSEHLYKGVSRTASNTQTSYKWSFAKDRSRVDPVALQSARDAVNQETFGDASAIPRPSGSAKPGRVLGPAMPSSSDVQFAKEQAEESAAMARQAERRKDRNEQRDRVEEMVGPKESGREGMLEKKRAQRETDKSFRDQKDDGGIEFTDSDLMGGGDSFKAMVARRDANRRRFEEKRRQEKDAKYDRLRENTTSMREKDKETMDMFKAMAKERFG